MFIFYFILFFMLFLFLFLKCLYYILVYLGKKKIGRKVKETMGKERRRLRFLRKLKKFGGEVEEGHQKGDVGILREGD